MASLLQELGVGADASWQTVAADGEGAIEFQNVNNGVVFFDEKGLAIGLDNDGEQALLAFEVVDGKLRFVDSENYAKTPDPIDELINILFGV